MSTTLILLSIIGGSIAFLVLGVITLMVWESNSRRPPSAQGNVGLSVGFKKYLGKVPVTIAAVVVLLIAAVWFFSSSDSPQPTPDKTSNSQSSVESKAATPTTQKPLVSQDTFASLDINLWLAVGILIALAIVGAFKKGGSAGTVALVVVVGALLLFGVEDALKILKKVQNGASSVVLSESKSATAEPSLGSNALPAAMTKVVTWSTYNQDGSVPVGVRSEEFELHDKCTLNNYPMGYGHIYVLWYYDEKSSAGWIVQKYDTGIVGANRKFAVEVLVPRVKKEEMKFLEVCPYTLPKE